MHNVKVLVQRTARKYRYLSPECRLNADGRSKRHRLVYTIKQRIRRNGRFRLDQRQIAAFHTAQPFNIAVDDTLQVGVHTNVQVYVGILRQAASIQLVCANRASPLVQTDVAYSLLLTCAQRTTRTGKSSVEDVCAIERTARSKERLHAQVTAYRSGGKSLQQCFGLGG